MEFLILILFNINSSEKILKNHDSYLILSNNANFALIEFIYKSLAWVYISMVLLFKSLLRIAANFSFSRAFYSSISKLYMSLIYKKIDNFIYI